MSDYFTYIPLTANTVARAADVNARFQAVEAGFALLPPANYLFEDRQTFSVDEGMANAYVANPAIPITAYNVGLHIVLQAANANTGVSDSQRLVARREGDHPLRRHRASGG